VYPILEGEALASAHRLDLSDHAVRLVVLAQLHDLAGQRLDALAKRLLPGLLTGAQVAERAHDRPLEIGERIGPILGRELPHQGNALLVERPAQELGDVLLHGAVAACVEARGDAIGELLIAGLERPGQPVAQLGRVALELGADVVHLGGRTLALQHPGPDLDGVPDGLHRRLAGLGPFAYELGRTAIVDGEPLDDEQVVERAHDAAAVRRRHVKR
jgi:hypothetical protein